ncbi:MULTISPECIES: hypothetical protein [unclassified Serinicoccus]|uniref:hypothetical protein n=1 Tax=unclassified Serinicoccus TaxID=2643101 RepID=UPI003852D6A6
MDQDVRGAEQGDRLLAQRSLFWKLACSVWVLLVAVGFVMFSVLGWALGAVLSRSKKMWWWTLVWGVLYVIAAVAMGFEGDASDADFIVFLTIWVGSTGHAAYLARGVLRTRAVALAKDQAWRTPTAGSPGPGSASMPTIPLPDGVPRLRGDLRDSSPPPPPGA